MADLIFAGFGGQGVLTAGLIVARTAMSFGDNVTWIPSYGSEMRGGTANCAVRISPGKIPSPFVGDLDLLAAMNVPSVVKFMPRLRAGGTLLVNSTMVQGVDFRGDIEVFAVPATEIGQQLSYARGQNIAMLGGLAHTRKLYDADVLLKGLEDFFALKGKSDPRNAACFLKGQQDCQKL